MSAPTIYWKTWRQGNTRLNTNGRKTLTRGATETGVFTIDFALNLLAAMNEL